MKAPCKDCPDREVGCHSSCARYKKYQAEKEAERRKRMEDHIVNEVRYEGWVRGKKQWNRPKRRKYT